MKRVEIDRWQVDTCQNDIHPITPPPKGFFPLGPWEPIAGSVVTFDYPQHVAYQSYVHWRRPLFRIPSLPLDDKKTTSTFTEFECSDTKPVRLVPEGWAVFSDWEQTFEDDCWSRVLIWIEGGR